MTQIIPTWETESQLVAQGAGLICGFDEVGRGALAGPVMVGCAAFQASRVGEQLPKHLRDSKMLNEKSREKLYSSLSSWPDLWAVGAASNAEIDAWGISLALGVAALRALAKVEQQAKEAGLALTSGLLQPSLFDEIISTDNLEPSVVSGAGDAEVPDVREPVDGADTGGMSGAEPLRVFGILDGPNDYISKALDSQHAPQIAAIPQMSTQVKGDAHCASVAAASDLAKVTRDRIMEELAQQDKYAAYEWQNNKGYGTKAHREAIKKHGPSDLHRVTWRLV